MLLGRLLGLAIPGEPSFVSSADLSCQWILLPGVFPTKDFKLGEIVITAKSVSGHWETEEGNPVVVQSG